MPIISGGASLGKDALMRWNKNDSYVFYRPAKMVKEGVYTNLQGPMTQLTVGSTQPAEPPMNDPQIRGTLT
jgi:hypothetical protein